MNQNLVSNLSSNNFPNKKQINMNTKRHTKSNMRSNSEPPSEKNINYLKGLGKVCVINDMNSTLQYMSHFSNNRKFIQNNRYSNNSHKRVEYNSPLVIKQNHANGILNVGVTCYMNSTLQCFIHVEELIKYLLKSENIIKISSNKNKYKLSNSFFEVIKNLWLNNKIKYYSPNDFKNLISEMCPLFKGNQASESKDLVLFLLEFMHNELNNAKNIAQPQACIFNQYDYNITFNLFVNYFVNNHQSIISDLFYGTYNSKMKCLICNIVSHNIICYNCLIFPLEEVRKYKKRMQNMVDIIECFEYYQKEDYYTGENQIFCNNCHKMANNLYTSQLLIAPKVLVIILNRGKGLQFGVKLAFGKYLDIKNFIYYKNSPKFL